jgi:hypothetical protein
VPSVGQRFTLNITITGVTGLYGYEVKVFYNSTQLDALWNVLPSDHFMRPLAGGTFFMAKNSSDNAYNATHKFAWFGGSLLAPELPRAGSGTLFQIVFNATAKGGPYPVYIDYPGNAYPAKLADSSSPPNAIPCTAEGGMVEVGVPIVPGQALLYINPSAYTALSLFQTFTMNITIANVTNLYSYEYKLFYNKTIVQALSADLPSNHFLKPVDPAKILIQKEVNNNYNSTHGRVWFSASLLNPEIAKGGNGPLTIITFKAMSRGSTLVHFEGTRLDTPAPVTPISHTTQDGQVIVNPPIVPSGGRMIDIFTQKEPYSGKGINISSDAFAPQSEVILYALITYNGEPVQNKLVSFEVTPPHSLSGFPLYRVSYTNETGIATISFNLPWQGEHPEEIVFGTWSAVAAVDITGVRVVDALTFRVGWIVEIISIATIDENLKPKTYFAKATCVGVRLHIRNIAMLPKTATIIVTAYDARNDSFGSIVLSDFNVEPDETYIFAYCFLNISAQAAIGNAMVSASAYTARPSMGGLPYCPEVSAGFVITSRDVAVINVTTSSVDVIAGQIVNVNVTVTNKGNDTETFSVSAYYGPFVIQTPISVASLSPNQNRTITFVWNTTYVLAGSYTIKAVAETLHGETETGDNTHIDGAVMVRYQRVLIFPRTLSIIALVVAAMAALLAIILLIIKRKKNASQSVMLNVDILPREESF